MPFLFKQMCSDFGRRPNKLKWVNILESNKENPLRTPHACLHVCACAWKDGAIHSRSPLTRCSYSANTKGGKDWAGRWTEIDRLGLSQTKKPNKNKLPPSDIRAFSNFHRMNEPVISHAASHRWRKKRRFIIASDFSYGPCSKKWLVFLKWKGSNGGLLNSNRWCIAAVLNYNKPGDLWMLWGDQLFKAATE